MRIIIDDHVFDEFETIGIEDTEDGVRLTLREVKKNVIQSKT